MDRKHQTPGVYVAETSLLPKSVVSVETAVPAFIGYTEKAVFGGLDFHALNNIQPLEINSFSEFETLFGGAPEPAYFEIGLDNNNSVNEVKAIEHFFMFYSVKLFYDNGGGTCLIVSVGNYTDTDGIVLKQQLLAGLASLEKTDTPTLLVIPDATKLINAEAGEIHAAMLDQSAKLKNRFAILDLVDGNCKITDPEIPVDEFRYYLGMNNLSYGAAYYPWLVTAYSRKTTGRDVLTAFYSKNGNSIDSLGQLFFSETIETLNKCCDFSVERIQLKKPSVGQANKKEKAEAQAEAIYSFLKEFYKLTVNTEESLDDSVGSEIHQKFIAKGSAFHKLLKRLKELVSMHHLQLLSGNFMVDFSPLNLTKRPAFLNTRGRIRSHSVTGSLKSLASEAELLVNSFYKDVESTHQFLQESLKYTDPVYHTVVKSIETQMIIVPSGGAVAGIFSMVDRARGVWKAPANVSLASVVLPAVEISPQDQEMLNINGTEGKSINAIRAFIGEGNLVWGARTLAGNDNEWRYINIRRLFIMVEQSVQEAIKPFLFEKNDPETWQRIKTMIVNFLNSLWNQGALGGMKPEHAYFVRIGLGESMTASDLENGIMNVEIGLAPVRPAEFIILKISNKMRVS